MAQTLNAAVLSKDAQFTSVIRSALSPHEIELVDLDDVLRFIDLISQEPFDLVVLDCEGLVAAKQVIGTLRQNGANREAVLAVAAPPGDPAAITAVGANVIMPKPLAPTQAKQFLHDAIEVIKKRHRQYVRHPMETEVVLQSDSKKLQLKTKSYCIGEGGIGLQLEQRLELGTSDVVRLSFRLPETVSNLEVSATLAYINTDLQAGFRFQPLSTSNSAKLSAWLNQQAPPPAGTPRKELVEAWLAEHGKESGTVVISAAIGKQLLAEKLAAEKAAAMTGAPVAPAPKPMPVAVFQPKRSRAAVVGYVLGGFVLGVITGLLLASFLHTYF